MRQSEDMNKFNRQLINDHVPYELVMLSTLRYYANLQLIGKLDIVELMMQIEDITEAEAIEKCVDIYKTTTIDRGQWLAGLVALTKQEEELNNFFDRFDSSN
jgi:hypothetical protein